MSNSIVVYRVLSETGAKDENLSYAIVMTLTKMGVLAPVQNSTRVIRENDVTVTVYYYEKA